MQMEMEIHCEIDNIGWMCSADSCWLGWVNNETQRDRNSAIKYKDEWAYEFAGANATCILLYFIIGISIIYDFLHKWTAKKQNVRG